MESSNNNHDDDDDLSTWNELAYIPQDGSDEAAEAASSSPDPLLTCNSPAHLTALRGIIGSARAADSGRDGPTPLLLDGSLWCGNMHDAEDLEGLRMRGIQAVLCVASGAAPAWAEDGTQGPLEIDFMELPGLDEENYPILASHFTAAQGFLDAALQADRHTLVHCVAGSNRSGAIVAAYLMVRHRYSLLEAVQHLVDARPIVLRNEGFLCQLVNYAQGIGRLDDLHSVAAPAEEEAPICQNHS
jgi:hypothetical protein